MRIAFILMFAGFMTMLSAEEITLRDGSKFKYTNLLKAEPDGIKVEYSDGIKKIPYEKLTDADRAKYSLTVEALKQYRAEKEERDKEKDAAAQEDEVKDLQAEKDAKDKIAKTPRLVTIEQVKAHWIRFFPEPSDLERNAREKKHAYARLIAIIKLGRYDNEAEEKALVWNISEYERCENIEAANRLREDLKAVRLKLVEESKLALQKTESDRAAVPYRTNPRCPPADAGATLRHGLYDSSVSLT